MLKRPIIKKRQRKVKDLWWFICRKISNGWYWLKCFIWHRYNVIHVRSLGPTWVDRDILMLHVCFQILCDYIDHERPFEHFVWDHSNEIANAKAAGNEKEVKLWEKEDRDRKLERKTLEELYCWWKEEYPKKREELSPELLSVEEQHNLRRLLDLREILWT